MFWEKNVITINPAVASAASEVKTVSDVENPNFQLSGKIDTPTGEISKESSPTDIEIKVCNKWGNECKVAIAVMKAESQGDPQRIGDKHLTFMENGREYGASYGLFQLRDLPGRFENPREMLDEDKNIEYAYNLYQKSGWKPWSAFKSGAYKKYL